MGYGEMAALTAAMLWAVASVLFRQAGSTVTPWLLNLYKGVLASLGFAAVMFFSGQTLLELPMQATALLLLSGLIGIGIGDTAFFSALNKLGERQAVLIAETLAPAIAYGLGFLFLGETLSLKAFGGVGLTVAGVAIAISSANVAKQATVKARGGSDSRLNRFGVGMAVLAAACQAIGVVLTRLAFRDSSATAVESSLLRLLGGLSIIALVLLWRFALSPVPSVTPAVAPLERNSADKRYRTFVFVILATFLGTWLGIFLQQTALLYTSAVVTQTLIATSVLFVIPIAWLLGESVSVRAVFGALVAFGGVALIVTE